MMVGLSTMFSLKILRKHLSFPCSAMGRSVSDACLWLKPPWHNLFAVLFGQQNKFNLTVISAAVLFYAVVFLFYSHC